MSEDYPSLDEYLAENDVEQLMQEPPVIHGSGSRRRTNLSPLGGGARTLQPLTPPAGSVYEQAE
jgi:hypothetical protein